MIDWKNPLFLESAATVILGFAAAITLAVKTAYQRQPKETPDVFGSARFMNDRELKQSGLLVHRQPPEADGVYIGAWKDSRGAIHYLRDASNGHVLMCGPTRSGKALSCILPTLLSWRGSAIVHDEKGELWMLTAAWRFRHVGPVIKWEPGAQHGSASWNPLSQVRLGTPHEIADAQNVALMLIDVRGHGLDRVDHWDKAAVALLTGCVLHELYLALRQRRPASLADIAQWFADPTRDGADSLWEEMRDNTHIKGQWNPLTYIFDDDVPHPLIAAEGIGQLNRSDRERSSVTSTLRTYLFLFYDDIVAANTYENDISLSEFADMDAAVTIYITTLPNDTVRLRPLTRLFLTTALRALMSPPLSYRGGQPVSPHRHNTLFLLDEFPSFGKLEEVETDLARAAGWGVKFLLVIQDITQLKGIYGMGHSVMSNLHTRAFFPTNDWSTAKELSDSTGTMTAQTPHMTIMGRRLGLLNQVSRTIQPTSRPLVTPGEIMVMRAAVKDDAGRIIEAGDTLILLMGHRPLKAQQMLYFQDPEFAARAQLAA